MPYGTQQSCCENVTLSLRGRGKAAARTGCALRERSKSCCEKKLVIMSRSQLVGVLEVSPRTFRSQLIGILEVSPRTFRSQLVGILEVSPRTFSQPTCWRSRSEPANVLAANLLASSERSVLEAKRPALFLH